VCEYKRVRPGKIARRRTHPNAPGFENDLYRIDGLPDDLAQSVETEFMKPVDGEADLALQKILRAAFEPWKTRANSNPFTGFEFAGGKTLAKSQNAPYKTVRLILNVSQCNPRKSFT
jgi:hypothetical protein